MNTERMGCMVIKTLYRIIKYFVRFFQMMKTQERVYLVLVSIISISIGVFPVISTLIFQEIINILQMSNSTIDYVLNLVLLYTLISVLQRILGVFSVYYEKKLKMRMAIGLDMSIVEKPGELTLKDFENANTYDIIQRASNINIEQVFSFFKAVILVIQFLISLVIYTSIIFNWKPILIPVIYIFPLISVATSSFFDKKQFVVNKERADKVRKKWYYKFLLTNDIAYKEIKIFNVGNYFRKKYKELSLSFFDVDKKILKERTIILSIFYFLDQIISCIILGYIILQTFMGNLLIGNMNTYIRGMSKISSNLQNVLLQLNAIYQNSLYIEQYFEYIDLDTSDSKNNKDIKLDIIPYIKINNLSYQYGNHPKLVLKNISLKIWKGNLVAFIGKNGSGKSTLMKILSTLYKDYEGDIYFGQYNIRDIDEKYLQRKIGVLFQDFIKYNLSIRENVSLGQISNLNDDTYIINTLRKAGIKMDADNLDQQLGFWFDSGIQISGGEWLKIALSRAFIREAEIYLLDEPNAALDPISERNIFKSFKDLCKNKIGIIISHRISSIKNVVDKIVVFENGTIESIGTHDELLQISKVYKELYYAEENE